MNKISNLFADRVELYEYASNPYPLMKLYAFISWLLNEPKASKSFIQQMETSHSKKGKTENSNKKSNIFSPIDICRSISFMESIDCWDKKCYRYKDTLWFRCHAISTICYKLLTKHLCHFQEVESCFVQVSFGLQSRVSCVRHKN